MGLQQARECRRGGRTQRGGRGAHRNAPHALPAAPYNALGRQPTPSPVASPEAAPWRSTHLQALPEWAQPTVQQSYQAVPQYQAAPRAPEPGFWSSIPPLIWVGIGEQKMTKKRDPFASLFALFNEPGFASSIPPLVWVRIGEQN